jgi:RNA polymerase sigma factor (sigma-70 family)
VNTLLERIGVGVAATIAGSAPATWNAASPGADIDHLAALLVAARAGEPRAFDRLIAACRPVVQRQARQHAWTASDVDDVIQEVWVRLVEHGGSIREPRALLAWLMMVTRRVAADLGRRGSRLVPAEADEDRPGPGSAEDHALRSFERHEISDGVRAALARLDVEDRRLLLLLDGDESLSYRDVSDLVQRPVGSLGPTRQRLLRRLRVDPAVRRLRLAS